MDEVDGLDLTERLVSPSEMAQIMRVDEADVLAWIKSGELDVQRGEDGQPWVPIREDREIGRSADGAAGFETGFTFYSGPRDRQLLSDARAERRARERDAQIAAAAATGVDIDALTAALALRLAAVAPPEVRIATTERGMVDVLDVRGGGAGVDVLLAVAGYENDSRSPADRVVDAGSRLLETAQDEIAELTTDPWPQQGSGTRPEPHAQLSQDSATVRLFYAAEDNPTLELAALPIIDVLGPSRSGRVRGARAARRTRSGFHLPQGAEELLSGEQREGACRHLASSAPVARCGGSGPRSWRAS